MLKKLPLFLSAFALLLALAACRSDEKIEEYEEDYTYVETKPTLEYLRAQFELFFEENKERVIASVATDGEDIYLELGEGYEFIMTILLDDIELNDDNRVSHILTFELNFSQMEPLFGGLAEEIRVAANIDHFRLNVIFIDVNEVIIARSNFDADNRNIIIEQDEQDDDADE